MKILKRILVLCLMSVLLLAYGFGTYETYAKNFDAKKEAKDTKSTKEKKSKKDKKDKKSKKVTKAKEATEATNTVVMKTATIDKQTWYLVENEEQLRAIGTGQYSLSDNYMLNADIYLSDNEWVPIGNEDTPFTGSFNGNGYEIWNLTMTSPTVKLIGLFGYATEATICNVTLRDLDISKAGGVGKSVGAIVALGIDCDIYDNEVYSKED